MKFLCTNMCLSDFIYETGCIVAALSEDMYCPLKIGRVVSSKKILGKLVLSLKVHWLQANKGIYHITYSFAFVNSSKKTISMAQINIS